MKEALKNFWWKSKLEQGMDHVLDIRDRFLARVNENEYQFKHEIEINDYAEFIWESLIDEQYLASLQDMTGCIVTVKGT